MAAVTATTVWPRCWRRCASAGRDDLFEWNISTVHFALYSAWSPVYVRLHALCEDKLGARNLVPSKLVCGDYLGLKNHYYINLYQSRPSCPRGNPGDI